MPEDNKTIQLLDEEIEKILGGTNPPVGPSLDDEISYLFNLLPKLDDPAAKKALSKKIRILQELRDRYKKE